jgi:hypothetical protein
MTTVDKESFGSRVCHYARSFHLLLSVDADTAVEKAVQFIKGGFAFRAGRELGLHAPVWQKGFSEIRVNDSGAFAKMRDYIHENPVKRFLSVTSTDYPVFLGKSTNGTGPAAAAPKGASKRGLYRHR